jgi:DNA mismatch repair protein MutS
VEDPKLAKGIVRREVVETVSPGVAFADDLLDGARNNFVVALHATAQQVGIAGADVSTGELRLCTVPAAELEAALAGI